MSETVMKVLVTTVLPYKNGRHVPHAPGDTVLLSKLTEEVVRAVSSGDPLLAGVLEIA